MTIPILSTKLYIPVPRLNVVTRPRLLKRLNEGLSRRLTVISASTGFGKTTLVSEWVAHSDRPVAWLSMDEGDNDPARFLTYLFAALRTVAKKGDGNGLKLLESPELPPMEVILTALLNDIADLREQFILVLDDYHVIKDKKVDEAITLLLERMPSQMHLVISTRENPRLPLARLRVRDQLTDIRVADLRFTNAEAAEFLEQVMGLSLSVENIDLLESRTEGWIAGLQLAALSIKDHEDPAAFVRSFSGSHHFVLDYLLEEVLQQQSLKLQTFLLRTSILDRLNGPLCDAVLHGGAGESTILSTSGQEMLEFLERANLFIVPLDHERRWYRYHHLFADLLRQRLHQHMTPHSEGDVTIVDGAELHIRASIWYEDHGYEVEAFQHANAAMDVDRAARLLEGEGMPLIFRGATAPVLNWLKALPGRELDARPSLWVIYASALLMVGQTSGVEPKLQATERAIRGGKEDHKTRDLIGHIAAIRATLAVSKHQAETIIFEANRALEYLHPDNLPVRSATAWALGYAYQLQGDRASASKAYSEALLGSQKMGHVMITVMSTVGLGKIQEADHQLYLAAETYRKVLSLLGDPPLPVACEAYLGLAQIFYEWNDLDAAMQHGQRTLQLAQQFEHADRVVAGEVFLARVKLAQGEASGAVSIIAKADHLARQHNFMNQMPQIAEVYVLVLLHQGNLEAAARLAQQHGSHLSLARVYLAQGDTSAALAVLEPLCGQMEVQEPANDRLKVMALLAVALYAHGDTLKAEKVLREVLMMAGPGGFIRTFLDEGVLMKGLLQEAAAHGGMTDYTDKLLIQFEADERNSDFKLNLQQARPARALIEPLSGRELEILRLIAQGLSNQEIGERLFLAVSTVKGHNRNIFGKLQVQRRTEAVALARKLGLL